MIRRAIDIGVVVLLLPLALPLALAAALTTALALGRPLIFRQDRAGLRGRVFALAKFRTMAPPLSAARALADDAARTPPAGRWLRRLRLDELPQLLSILRGDMALIGPRPLLPATIAAMGRAGGVRASVRPGLTGWAQVNGNALLSDTEKLEHDIWYVRNRSALLDLEIIVRTIGVIMFGERREGERHEGDRRRRG